MLVCVAVVEPCFEAMSCPAPLPHPQAITQLIKTKTGEQPLMAYVFPKQEAVAVLMPSMAATTSTL